MVDARGLQQVLEVVQVSITQRDRGREEITHTVIGGAGEEDLAAVGNGAQARAAVDRRPTIVPSTPIRPRSPGIFRDPPVF